MDGPAFVAALIWGWMYNDQFGIFNGILGDAGVKGPIWLGADTALAALIVVLVWKSFPLQMVVLLAGLQGIPRDLHEAAEVEGASWVAPAPAYHAAAPGAGVFRGHPAWRRQHVSLLLDSLDPHATGPSRTTNVVPIATYNIAFSSGDLGYGSAAAFSMFFVLLIVAVLYLRYYVRFIGRL